MPTILTDARRTSWLPKKWYPFWKGSQRFLLIFHLTRLAFGFNLDIGEAAGSLNLHFGQLILKISLFVNPDLLRPRLKKYLRQYRKTGEVPNLTSPFSILNLKWDPTHLGLAVVLDPLDYQYNLNFHLLSLVLTVGIPIRPSFTAASRAADLLYLETTLDELTDAS